MIFLPSFILALGILIFVHELGHFIMAKLFGVGVEKFSLGFGPKLIGKKIGETEYLISVFPLGGYVKMIGEGGEEELSPEVRPRSFMAKSPLKRIAIVAAGPLFNIIFAFFVYSAVFMHGAPVPTSKIKVMHDKPAERAGLKSNDVVTAINGKTVRLWEDLSPAIREAEGRPLQVKVKRGEEELQFTVKPETAKEKNVIGEMISRPIIGVEPSGEMAVLRFGVGESVIMGAVQTWDISRLISVVVVKLVQGKISIKDNLGGPIRIAVEAGKQAEAGVMSFVLLLAGLSVNLGILNLLPIPILDGGHIAFNLWEVIFRRPVSLKAREIAQQIGLVILVSLMFLAIYNDIVNYVLKQG